MASFWSTRSADKYCSRRYPLAKLRPQIINSENSSSPEPVLIMMFQNDAYSCSGLYTFTNKIWFMFRDLARIKILLEGLLSSTPADQVPSLSQFSVYHITITSPFHISVPSIINCSLSRSLRSFLIYRATLRLIHVATTCPLCPFTLLFLSNRCVFTFLSWYFDNIRVNLWKQTLFTCFIWSYWKLYHSEHGDQDQTLGRRIPWANRLFSRSMKRKILNFLHEVEEMISVISVRVKSKKLDFPSLIKINIKNIKK